MPRIASLALGVVALAGVFGSPIRAEDGEFVFHHENVMGTSLELRLRADSPAAASAAEGRVLREIDRLSALLSGYDPASEFRRWQGTRKEPVAVSPELFEVLQACDCWRGRTGGAFDPRVAALSRLWSACEKLGRLPTADEIAEARRSLSGEPWSLDPVARTATHLTDAPLSLDAIAKGFIVGRACAAALRPDEGVDGALLNIGGDLRVAGTWRQTLGIVDPKHDSETSGPLTSITVQDRAVATSGRSQRGYRIGGRWYSHILDPRTGRPVEATVAATVIARDSAAADALATAFNVLDSDESLALAKATPGVECLLVAADGRVIRSDGFGRFETPSGVALARGDPVAAYNAYNEVVVKFELGNASGGARRGFRRQYVAIWIEDGEGFPVRTLLLWGRGRWVADLKRWSQKDQARRAVDDLNLRRTISRPTRPPGKYEAVWDGKDDHGKFLDPGAYTLYIEAAREHGTYQKIQAQVKLAARGQPLAPAEELKGNVEIRSASIEYRRPDQGK